MRELTKINLGGAEHNLRPTWEAYGEIEARCGPLNALYRNVGYGNATLKQLATIVAIGMKASGTSNVDENSVSMRIYENGVWDEEAVIFPILRFLESLGWTPDQRKKREAEMEKVMAGTASALWDKSSPSPQQSTD